MRRSHRKSEGAVEEAGGGAANFKTCAHCRHFEDDAVTFERTFRGMLALSSAHGDTRGDQGICGRHGQMLAPCMTCHGFEAREGEQGRLKPRVP